MKAKELKKLEKLELPDIILNYFSGYETFQEGWEECNNPECLLGIAAKLKVDQRKLTLAVGYCANLIRDRLTDQRFIKALDTLIDFGNGKASKEELRKARKISYKAFKELDQKEIEDAIAFISTHLAVTAAENASYIFTIHAIRVIELLYNVLGKESEKQIAEVCKQYLTEEVLNKYNEL